MTTVTPPDPNSQEAPVLQLKRRQDAGRRLAPLEDGTRDPWAAVEPFGRSDYGLNRQELWHHAAWLRDRWGWQTWELAERFEWPAA